VLIVVMLVHPVSTFAAVSAPLDSSNQSMSLQPTQAETVDGMPAAGEQSASDPLPCHSAAGNTDVPAGDCCDTMDSAACLLICYSPACAVTVASVKDTAIDHVAFQSCSLPSYRFQSLSGIFHPPRTS
jgi:hypothetical protein